MCKASARLLSCRPASASLLTPLRLTARCCTGDKGGTLGVKENAGPNLGGEEGPPAGSERKLEPEIRCRETGTPGGR